MGFESRVSAQWSLDPIDMGGSWCARSGGDSFTKAVATGGAAQVNAMSGDVQNRGTVPA